MQDQIINLKKQLICLKEGHEGESLDYVCLENDCQKPQLLCYLCKTNDHPSHATDSLRILLYEILSVEDSTDSCTKLTVELDQLFNQIRSFLLMTKSQYMNADEVVKVFETYAFNTKENIMAIFNIKDSISDDKWTTKKEFQGLFFETIMKNYQFLQRNDKNPNPVNLYEKAITLATDQLTKIITELEKLKKEKRLTDHQVFNLFPVQLETRFKVFRPVFSENLKGTCMQLHTPTKAQMTTSGQQRLLLLDPSLEGNNRTKKWKVKVHKLASWIGIGACHLNKIKEANFNFFYSSTGHGSYMISSNGYSWSSYKAQFNSKFEPFSFTTGDIILVQFSNKQKMIKYKKESTEQTYSIEVEFNGDPLHPAINLTGIGDCVQILQ